MTDTTHQIERPLSDTEVADLLGVSRNTLKHWRWIGKGPRYLKLVSKIAYRPTDIRQWLEDNVIEPGPTTTGTINDQRST